MGVVQRKLTKSFRQFFRSKQSSGIVLIVCTIISLVMTNSVLGPNYLSIWNAYIGGLTVEHWINDGLMAIFFLFIGLELERELYSGELSDFRNAVLPMIAAAGGLTLPALLHFALNAGTPTQAGIGIPMATDIAFALGTLALLGSRVPASLKVFLTALAVMDDLGAIIVIAIFYTASLSIAYLLAALAVFATLVILNRYFRVMTLLPYIAGGILIWYLMLKSGVHATIAGVLLAFAIPYSAKEDDEESPSHRLEHFLHQPVAFLVLPIFALANTGIIVSSGWVEDLSTPNNAGIALGLILGKPIGITVLSFIAVATGMCRLPLDLDWRHIFGAGILGGIGFTMSIFITNLAYAGQPTVVNSSKMAILFASLIAGVAGFLWLKVFGKPKDADHDPDTMDFEEASPAA